MTSGAGWQSLSRFVGVCEIEDSARRSRNESVHPLVRFAHFERSRLGRVSSDTNWIWFRVVELLRGGVDRKWSKVTATSYSFDCGQMRRAEGLLNKCRVC